MIALVALVVLVVLAALVALVALAALARMFTRSHLLPDLMFVRIHKFSSFTISIPIAPTIINKGIEIVIEVVIEIVIKVVIATC